MTKGAPPLEGQRVEVRARFDFEDDPWHPGTVLDGGRVDLDDWHRFLPEPPFILEPEEVTEWRPI